MYLEYNTYIELQHLMSFLLKGNILWSYVPIKGTVPHSISNRESFCRHHAVALYKGYQRNADSCGFSLLSSWHACFPFLYLLLSAQICHFNMEYADVCSESGGMVHGFWQFVSFDCWFPCSFLVCLDHMDKWQLKYSWRSLLSIFKSFRLQILL